MKRKQLTIILSATAITVAAIGATFAYLHDTTDRVTNAFASEKDIDILLREPLWDGYEFTDGNYTNGESAKPAVPDKAALGVVQAQDYVPGQEIPKNPKVKNVGKLVDDKQEGVECKVALKVEYLDEAGKVLTYDEFKKAYLTDTIAAPDQDDLDFEVGTGTNQWTQLAETEAGYDVYLYNSTVAVGEETTPLFTEVPLSWDLEPGTDGKMPEFKIKITAYAIQADVPSDVLNQTMLDFVAGK